MESLSSIFRNELNSVISSPKDVEIQKYDINISTLLILCHSQQFAVIPMLAEFSTLYLKSGALTIDSLF